MPLAINPEGAAGGGGGALVVALAGLEGVVALLDESRACTVKEY
jgi:hypothetical protein